MKRTSSRVLAAAALAAGTCLPAPAGAVVTDTWSVASYEDFDEGEANNSFITSLGEVRAGWETKRLEIAAGSVWSAVRGTDGTVYLGTDDEGTILQVRDDAVTKLAKIPDVLAVVSLAAGSGGTLYAGTMPGGQVWKVSPGGKAEKLATLEDAETVWALTTSADGRSVYAGTGPKGELFEVDATSGKARVALATDDKRIVSLTRTSDGAIWLGTSERALVFRYDPTRKRARAMGDFAGNEITAIAPLASGVVVTANDLEEPTTTDIKTKAAVEKAEKEPDEGQKPDMPKTGTAPGAEKATPEGAKIARKGGRKGKGALYRIGGDGRLDQLHALTATYFTSLAVTDDGDIYAGAGDKGRVYLVSSDDSVATAFDVDERLIAALLWDPKRGLSFASADSSAFYRTVGAAKRAIYESKVFDSKAPARYGKIVWFGEGDIAVQTRTGNTATPGKGWSEWARPTGVVRGGGSSQYGRIANPSGRYVQFRAKLGGKGSGEARLRKAAVYYLPQNRATDITDIAVRVGSKKDLVTMESGPVEPRSPVTELKWKVENPDDDETVYRLEVRREGEVLWREVPTGKKNFTATSFEWNTETFADGYYRLRVTASDRRANSADRARQTHRVTHLFLVDNSKPRIDGISIDYPVATARASDSMSAISEMAFSVDDGPWQLGTTQDGLFDDPAELLRIALPADLQPGLHTLSIRVADEAGNLASATASFRTR